MRFVHAADLHVDSPLRGLERYEGAPVDGIRGATRRAVENLVQLCLDEEVDALLLAGDLFDGDWKDYSTGLFFVSQLARLREGSVRVFLIRGNHDAASQVTRHLRLPEHCTELATRRPQTVTDEDLGLAVHGQGYASRAVTEDLAASYPDPVSGLLNVGLLHTSLDGREGHEPYAPTSVAVLEGKGYDYWALGHVHRREVLSEDPWIVFPGNLQGRHARETGEKGATLVEVEDGRITEVVHRTLDVVRWERLELDATEVASADDLVELAAERLEDAASRAEGRLLAVRLDIVGASRAHGSLAADPEKWTNELRARALDTSTGEVWLEKVRLGTRATLDLAALAEREDAIGSVVRALRDLRADDEALLALAAELDDLKKALPPEAKEGPDGLRFDRPAELRALLEDVEQLLLPRLMARGR